MLRQYWVLLDVMTDSYIWKITRLLSGSEKLTMLTATYLCTLPKVHHLLSIWVIWQTSIITFMVNILVWSKAAIMFQGLNKLTSTLRSLEGDRKFNVWPRIKNKFGHSVATLSLSMDWCLYLVENGSIFFVKAVKGAIGRKVALQLFGFPPQQLQQIITNM